MSDAPPIDRRAKAHEIIHAMGLAQLIPAVILGFLAAVLIVASPMIGMAATIGLLGYAVVTRRAEIPFTLLVLSFAIPYQKTVAGIPLNMSDGIIVLWGLAWPFLMMRQDRKLKIPYVVWATLPLVLCACLSLFVAVNPGGAFKQILRLTEWFIVLPILMMSLRSADNFWKWAALVFLLIPPLFALDGVVEVIMNGRSISSMLHIPHPIPSAAHSMIRHTFDVSGRAGSTFGGAQGLAMYLTMMMSIIIAVIIAPPSPIFRKIGFIVLTICIAGMVVAKSRGGLLGCMVMMIVITLVTQPKFGFSMLVAGGIVLAIGIIGFLLMYSWDGTITGLIPGRKAAVMDRLIIWGRALQVFLGHPVLGVGFGNFHDEVYATGGINLTVPLGYESLHCHNTYLEVLTGTGFLGIVSFIGFLGFSFRYLLKGWRERKGKIHDCFILGALGAQSAYMMFGMVDMLFVQNMHFVLITILTLGAFAIQRNREET